MHVATLMSRFVPDATKATRSGLGEGGVCCCVFAVDSRTAVMGSTRAALSSRTGEKARKCFIEASQSCSAGICCVVLCQGQAHTGKVPALNGFY